MMGIDRPGEALLHEQWQPPRVIDMGMAQDDGDDSKRRRRTVGKRSRARAWVRDVEGQVRTGDLILFSSQHASSNITKFFTASEWDHIGLVLVTRGDAYVLEWEG